MDSETDFDNRASTDETFLSEAEDFDDVFASALGMISDLRVDSQSLKAEQWNYICRESGWENLKQEDINEVANENSEAPKETKTESVSDKVADQSSSSEKKISEENPSSEEE